MKFGAAAIASRDLLMLETCVRCVVKVAKRWIMDGLRVLMPVEGGEG